MKFRSLFCLVALALPLSSLSAAEEAAAPTPKPSLWIRMVHPFGWKKELAKQKDHTATGFRNLEMGMTVDPNPVKIPDTRQMKVTLTLTNKGAKMVQLDFPTSQRVEVLLKAKDGKTVEQWSQDQAFNNEPTLVTINPNERLEYSVNVATRDMVIGETYTLEGFFPNFDALRRTHPVTAAGK